MPFAQLDGNFTVKAGTGGGLFTGLSLLTDLSTPRLRQRDGHAAAGRG